MRRFRSKTGSFITLLLLLHTEKTAIAQSKDAVDDVSAYDDKQDSETCFNQPECPLSSKKRRDIFPRDHKTSRHCPSLPLDPLPSQSSLLQPFYNVGMSAQAYKPTAPVKRHVCHASSGSVNHNVARNPIWRTNYRESVPITIRGNIYSCGSNEKDSMPMNYDGRQRHATVEVWQPRPDGTYSSLRNGIQDGDCRATLPITTDTIPLNNFELGHFVFETLAPGSTGVLGGLVPDPTSFLFGDYPPYSPGRIHFLVHIPGYYPLLVELNMKDVGRILSNDTPSGSFARDIWGRSQFFGGDWSPHGAVVHDSDSAMLGGMELQFATVNVSFVEIEVDFFVVPVASRDGRRGDISEVMRARDFFCSSGHLGWIPSFFKEPISVCSSSLLDFFAL